MMNINQPSSSLPPSNFSNREIIPPSITTNSPIKTELGHFTEEQISRLSLIDQFESLARPDEFTKGNFFSNLNLSSMASETGYEGLNDTIPVNWVNFLLKHYHNPTLQSFFLPFSSVKIEKSFSQLAAINNAFEGFEKIISKHNFVETLKLIAQRMAGLILNLSKGEQFILPGGWGGLVSGHSMYYLFRKEEDGHSFTVVIYNNNEMKVNSTKRNHLQTRQNPYVCFKGVQLEELFFAKEQDKAEYGLLYRLLEIKFSHLLNQLNPEYIFNEKDVLKSFDPISHRLIDSDNYYRLFSTLQRSGNCSQKSVNILLHDLFRDVEEFKRFCLNSRFLSLLVLFKHFQLNQDENIAFQLHHGVIHFCQMTENFLKRFPNHSYHKQLERFYATGLDILSKVRLFENDKGISKLIFSVHQNKFSNTTEKKVQLNLSNLLREIPQVKNAFTSNFFYELYDLNRNGEDYGENFSTRVEYVFSLIPPPKCYPGDSIWSRQILPFTEATIQSLSNVIHRYLEHQQFPLAKPQQYITLMSGLAILHYMVWSNDAVEKGRLKNLSLNLTFFESALATLDVQTAQQWETLNHLINYFKSIKSKNSIFDYSNVTHILDKSFLPELQMYEKMIEDHPQYHSLFQDFVKQYPLLVNSSLSTTQIIGLNGLLDCGTEDFRGLLQITGYGHLGLLKEMVIESLISLQSNVYKISSPPTRIGFFKDSINLYYQAFGKYKHFSKFELSAKSLPNFGNVKKEQIQPFIGINEKLSEQTILMNALSMKEILEREILKLFSLRFYPHSFISSVISLLKANFEILKEPLFRKALWHCLFLPCYSKDDKSFHLPIFEVSIEQKGIYTDLFMDLIQQLFINCYELKKLSGINWNEVLFIVNLAATFSIEKVIQKNSISLDFLERLEKEILQETPLCLDHLYKLNCLKLYFHFENPLSTWSDENYISAYTLWLELVHQREVVDLDETFQDLYNKLANKIYEVKIKCAERLQTFSKQKYFLDSLVARYLHKIGIHSISANLNDATWKRESVFTFIKSYKSEFILIDLSSDSFITDKNAYAIESKEETKENFNRLFKERLSYSSALTSVEFNDSVYGMCRIIGGEIHRKINNQWYLYLDQNALDANFTLPSMLKGGYSHWTLITEHKTSYLSYFQNQPEVHLLISDLATGQIEFIAHQNGIVSFERQEVLAKVDFSIPSCFSFEHSDYIRAYFYQGQKSKLEFIRYKTPQNSSLAFLFQDNKWVYACDRSYSLVEDVSESYLGNFTGFLALKDTKGNKVKILVPLSNVISEGYSTKASSKIELEENEWTDTRLTLSYIELRFVNGEVVADQLEGWLMLTLIALAQKNYLKAKSYFNHVMLGEAISSTAVQIFRWIIESSQYTKDYSPNACALQLLAFWMLKKLDPFTNYGNTFKDPFLQKHQRSMLIAVFSKYLDGLNHIYDTLQLSKDIELDLIGYIDKEEFHLRKLFLEKEDHVEIDKTIQTPSPSPSLDQLSIGKKDPDHFSLIQDEKLIPLLNFETSRMEENFFVQYSLFKSGTIEQRKNLAYYLEQRKEAYFKNKFPYYLNILIFVYQHPLKAPEAILPSAPMAQKIKWYREVLESMEKYFSWEKIIFSRSDNFSFFKNENKTVRKEPLQPNIDFEFVNNLQPETFLNSSLEQFAECISERNKASLPKLVEFAIEARDLGESERLYGRVIEKEFSALNQELRAGFERINDDKEYSFDSNPSLLLNRVENFLKILQSKTADLEKNILQSVNHLPNDPAKNLQVRLSLTGLKLQPLTMLQLVQGFLQISNGQDIIRLTSQLSERDKEALKLSLIHYLILKTELDHAKKIIHLLNKYKHLKNSSEKDSILQEAAQTLLLTRQYDPFQNLEALYFEFASGMRLRRDQVKLYSQVIELVFSHPRSEDRFLAFQSMPGSGKSSVYLSLLLERAAQNNFLSVLVCHPFQIASAKNSIKFFQHHRYGKNLIFLNFSPQELGKIEVLNHIEKTFKEALESKDQFLIDSSTLRFLQLQWLSYLKLYAKNENEVSIEAIDRIKKLQWINTTLLTKGFGAFDEMDLSLNINEQANLSQGEACFLKESRLKIVTKIFKLLALPKYDRFLQLTVNQQNHLRLKDYWELIIPSLLAELLQISPELMLKNSMRGAFERFVASAIPKEQEKWVLEENDHRLAEISSEIDKENMTFLSYLHKELACSPQEEKKEAAHLISLVRAILGKILLSTLQKCYNKDYGLDPENPEKVIPYLAVDVPSNTETAFIYEKLCYTLQTALNAPLPKKLIEQFIERMIQQANKYVVRGEKFEKTVEAKEFERLTGVPLGEALSDANLDKICDFVNRSPLLKLDIESWMASQTLTYFPSLVNSSSIALVDQFKKVTGCSGTFNNLNSFNGKISLFIPDEGAEGKILLTLLNRSKQGEAHVTELDPADLNLFIKKSLDQLDLTNARCLIDGEAALKKFTSYQVTRAILDYYAHDKKSVIKGVLFFHREEKDGKLINEGFALLKQGETIPHFISGNSAQEIEKYGIQLDQIFFYLDQPRSVGTDLPMPLQSQGIGTASVDSLREIVQMVMRLRQFLKSQDLKLAVTSSSKNILVGESTKIIDLFKTCLKNQAIKKAHETFKAFKEHLPNFYRSALIKIFLEVPHDQASKIYQAYADFFETNQEDLPYEQFGFLTELNTPEEILKSLAERYASEFSRLSEAAKVLDREIREQIQRQVGQQVAWLLARIPHIQELDCLFENEVQPLGLQVHQQVEQKLQLDTDLELDLELKSYLKEIKEDCFEEVPWNEQAINPWNEWALGPKIQTLKSVFEDFDHKNGWIEKKGLYRRDYTHCFPGCIKLTENLVMTLNAQLSVFHPLQKTTESILVRQTEQNHLEFILLSKKDTEFWAQLGHTPEKIWLVNMEGLLILKSKLPLETGSINFENYQEILWYINLFEGNINALERRPFLTAHCFNDENGPLKNYLELRCKSDPLKRSLYQQSLIFDKRQEFNNFSALREQAESNKRKELERYSPDQLNQLPEHLVPFVPDQQIPSLRNKALIRSLLPHQINFLTPLQVNELLPLQIAHLHRIDLIQSLDKSELLKFIPKKFLKDLTAAQKELHPSTIKEKVKRKRIRKLQDPDLIDELNPEQLQYLLPSQIPLLKEPAIQFLRKKEHLQAIRSPHLINFIDPSCVVHLTNDQLKFLTNPLLVRQASAHQIPSLSPKAIPHLNVLEQFPFLEEEQYAWIGDEQVEILIKLDEKEEMPANLYKIWKRVNPGTIYILREILYRCDIIGDSSRTFVLNSIKKFSEADYLKISYLNIAYVKLIHLPEEVYRCQNLNMIKFVEVNFSACEPIQSFALCFPKLQIFEMCLCKIPDFPGFIQGCYALTTLNIAKVELATVPSWLGEFVNLTWIAIENCQLKEIPKEIGNLRQLNKLYLNDNSLLSLPEEIAELPLENLEIVNNRLQYLPQNIGKLLTLKTLFVENNQLQEIPVGFEKLKALYVFDATNNQIKTIPVVNSELEAIQAVGLAGNPLKEFPVIFLKPSLRFLNLLECEIENIPREINQATQLNQLVLKGNPLQNIAPEFFEIPLVFLNLGRCGLSDSSLEDLTKLSKLKRLNLENNPIKKIPKGLQALEHLYLSETQISPDDPEMGIYKSFGCNVLLADKLTPDCPEFEALHGNQMILHKIDFENFYKNLDNKKGLKTLIQEKRLDLIKLGIESGKWDPEQLIEDEAFSLLSWVIQEKHDDLLKMMVLKVPSLLLKKNNDQFLFEIVLDYNRDDPSLLNLLLLQNINLDLDLVKKILGKIKALPYSDDKENLFKILKNRISPNLISSALGDKFYQLAKRKKPLKSNAFLKSLGDFCQTIHLAFAKVFNSSLKREWSKLSHQIREIHLQLKKKRKELDTLVKKMDRGVLTRKAYRKLSPALKKEIYQFAKKYYPDLGLKLTYNEFKYFTKDYSPDQILTNSFLDKSWILNNLQEYEVSEKLGQRSLYGMRADIAGQVLCHAFLKASAEKECSESCEIIKRNCLLSFTQAIDWERRLTHGEEVDEIAQEIVEKVYQLETNERILIPCGNSTHLFLVQIQKTDAQHFSLKIINTGLGLHLHPQRNGKYQTFIQYINLPLRDLAHVGNWKSLLSLNGSASDSVDENYKIIQSNLCKAGVCTTSSDDPLDYSFAQFQGTCSTAPWWSWLRHESVILFNQGRKNRHHAYADWRLVKHQIRKYIYEEYRQEPLQEKVRGAVLNQLHKESLLVQFLNIAENSTLFNHTLNEIKEYFLKYSPDPHIKSYLERTIKDFSDFNYSGDRWHLLRTLSLKVINDLKTIPLARIEDVLKDLEQQGKNSVFIGYVLGEFYRLNEAQHYFTQLLENAAESHKWELIGSLLGKFTMHVKYSALVVNLCAKWLNFTPSLSEESARKQAVEEIRKNFLWMLRHSPIKKQVSWALAREFVHSNKKLSKIFFKHIIYNYPSDLMRAIQGRKISYEELKIVTTRNLSKEKIQEILMALQDWDRSSQFWKIVHQLCLKLCSLDNPNFSFCRNLSRMFFALNQNDLAEFIQKKTFHP